MSRYPHHREGKLLSIFTLTYEEGKPTSSGEAQFLSVKEQVEIWYILENISSFVFDTTATNTGCRKESLIVCKSGFTFGDAIILQNL